MARWLRERLLFRSAKPSPPQPDYAPGPAEQHPDLLAAYRLQRERDFEDPYAGGGGGGGGGAATGGTGCTTGTAGNHDDDDEEEEEEEARCCRGSPRRRLIRVDAPAGPREPDKMMILDDYADPFDTTQEASRPAGEQERLKSEGYMDPYEAQRLLAEIQQKGSKEELATPKPLHLYDTPYEEVENGTDPHSKGPPTAPCRYSWLPEDDERPPEEYDQPWEWKKERISRVFAVDMEGVQELPWPPPVGQLESLTNHLDSEGPATLQSISASCLSADSSSPSLLNTCTSPSGSKAPASSPHEISGTTGATKRQLLSCPEQRSSACWLSLEPGLAFGERVNPTLPLESQAWYHGTLSRVDAEGLLRLCREASYLVRNSESSRDAFSLSLKSSQGFLHMKLSQTEDHKFVLGQHSPPFDNISEIIHHYASHQLPIKGAEHMTLLYPVATQPSSCHAAEQ